MKLIQEEAPHITAKDNVFRRECYTIIALLPAVIASVIVFGFNALAIILISVLTAVIIELLIQKIKKQKLKLPLGGIITGLLLALIISPFVPLWLPIFGVLIALLIGKHCFGTRNHVFNPALVGRAFLVVSWPLLMTTWTLDAITKATPLSMAKNQGMNVLVESFGSKILMYKALFFGNILGSIGETSAIALLIGGIFLIIMKIIDWEIPFTYLLTVAVLAFITKQDILFHLLAGGLIIGAFFMATDYVTTPLTKKGKIIFAFGCGLLTFLIRMYSGLPEGVMFSILFMNALSPLIDRFTKPKPFGWRKPK